MFSSKFVIGHFLFFWDIHRIRHLLYDAMGKVTYIIITSLFVYFLEHFPVTCNVSKVYFSVSCCNILLLFSRFVGGHAFMTSIQKLVTYLRILLFLNKSIVHFCGWRGSRAHFAVHFCADNLFIAAFQELTCIYQRAPTERLILSKG